MLHPLGNEVVCISRSDNTKLGFDSLQKNNSFFRHYIQTGSQVHPSSYSTGNGGSHPSEHSFSSSMEVNEERTAFVLYSVIGLATETGLHLYNFK
jgi:hypothetical protein